MICFIIAMEEEIGRIIEELNLKIKEINGKRIYYNDEVAFGLSGIGKVNAANMVSLMVNHFENIKEIINIGIAGGYDYLEQGDILIGDKIIYHDFDLTHFSYQKGEVPGGFKYFQGDKKLIDDFSLMFKRNNESFKIGNIASGDKFILKKEEIDLDYEIYGIDMEIGGVGQTAMFYNIPFVAIKIISDILEKESKLSYNEFEMNCKGRISNIILRYLEGKK